MKQSLEGSKDVQKPEIELTFQIADRLISIHKTADGYDYARYFLGIMCRGSIKNSAINSQGISPDYINK